MRRDEMTLEEILDMAEAEGVLLAPSGDPGPAAPPEEPPPPPEDPTRLSAVEHKRLKRLLCELANRRREALRLYEPLPVLEKFHEDTRKKRLVRGSNRAGKTLGAAVELARAACGCDPTGKYPKADGRAAIVGLKGEHLADVIYRKLCRPGAFRIIKDGETKEWRAFRPAVERERFKESKPAPPLIPRRMIKDIAWEEKKTSTPRRITMHNGWEITFYSSKGTPPNGIDIDYLWLDEEIENEGWWPEMIARLLDRHGVAVWSATPQVASMHLYGLHLQAEDDPEEVGEHVTLLCDNPHIDEDEKRSFEASLPTDEERRVRVLGEFAMTGFRIYPNFDMGIHGYDLEGEVPRDWARYMIVDPGRQVCAVLFAAVPPPSAGNFLLLYDELYLKACDADTFGLAVGGRQDVIQPEAFYIDGRAGRVTDIGSGMTVESQYSAALKRHARGCKRTGFGFTWGSDDVKAGLLAVHEYLRIRGDGTPALRVARGRLPRFEHEIQRYHYKKINNQVSDEPEKRNDHLADCLRYLCSARPGWAMPVPYASQLGYAVRYMRDKADRARAKREASSSFRRLGPGGSRLHLR